MRSTIVVFISFYHDALMRLHLDFYRLSRRCSLYSHRHCMTIKTIRNDHKRSKAIIIDHPAFSACRPLKH